jgi:hypothetical protein
VPTKPNWLTLCEDHRQELGDCVQSPGWRIIPGSELPSVFPDLFRQKIDSAVVVTAPTSTGGTYLAYSANRVDYKEQMIDVEPFGLIVHSTGPSSSGVFLHHGDWDGRSESPPDGFWEEASRSGIGDYFFSNPPGGLREGTLDQLPKGHRGAFDALVVEIRARVDGRRK